MHAHTHTWPGKQYDTVAALCIGLLNCEYVYMQLWQQLHKRARAHTHTLRRAARTLQALSCMPGLTTLGLSMPHLWSHSLAALGACSRLQKVHIVATCAGMRDGGEAPSAAVCARIRSALVGVPEVSIDVGLFDSCMGFRSWILASNLRVRNRFWEMQEMQEMQEGLRQPGQEGCGVCDKCRHPEWH